MVKIKRAAGSFYRPTCGSSPYKEKLDSKELEK